jgi:hypothetical protein
MPLIYCDDEMMAYRSARKIFQLGERVVFDEGYRLAHLPLVNAGHPAVVSEVGGRDYRNGIYEKTRYALVMPVSADAFLESDEAQALELAMKSASFAPKIAWEMGERRRLRLHATLAGGVPETDLDRYVAVVQNLLDQNRPRIRLPERALSGHQEYRPYLFSGLPAEYSGRRPICAGAKKHRHSSDEALPRRILSYESGTRSAGNKGACRTDRSVAGSDRGQNDHSLPGIVRHQR